MSLHSRAVRGVCEFLATVIICAPDEDVMKCFCREQITGSKPVTALVELHLARSNELNPEVLPDILAAHPAL
jgi:hypothetical protein